MKTTTTTLLVLGAALNAFAMHATHEVVQAVDTRDYILAVASPYGEVGLPVGGVSTNSWHSLVYCSIDGTPVYEPEGTTVHSQSGFSGEGIDPSTGSGDSAWVMLTNVNSTLAWVWTDFFWVTWSVSGQGDVAGTYPSSGGWYSATQSHLLRAIPDYGWLFTGWSGGASGGPSATNLNFTATAPTNLLASFSDDPDGDGLKNTDEWAVGANPWIVDTDGDGFDDRFEFDHGLSPTRDSSAFLGHIENNPDIYGLYPSNAVLDVAIGQMLLDIDGGNMILYLQLEQSEDLSSWTNAGEAVEWVLPVEGSQSFFRIRSHP